MGGLFSTARTRSPWRAAAIRGGQQAAKEVMALAVSHIACADFNLHSVPSATFQDPDASGDDGSQRHVQPLEITGFWPEAMSSP